MAPLLSLSKLILCRQAQRSNETNMDNELLCDLQLNRLTLLSTCVLVSGDDSQPARLVYVPY
jgi:hypothetical protein